MAKEQITLDDIDGIAWAMSPYMCKDNTEEKHLVLNLKRNSRYHKTLKQLNDMLDEGNRGGRYGKDKLWHYPNPTTELRRQISRALFFGLPTNTE